MKLAKKLSALLLAVIMVFSLAACKESETTNDGDKDSMTEKETTLYTGDDADSTESQLANTHKLLTTDKKLTIGYIGGSITYGGSAKEMDGDIDLSWVNRTSAWFQQKYPEATIETVNAGLSDTATNFGLFRLEKTLMNEDGHDMPDLVFVEFTVNDVTYATQTAEDLERQSESLFLNIWKYNPYAEIVTVVTARNESKSRGAYKAVSEHYNVPFVDMGIPLQAKITEKIGTTNETADNYYYTVDNLHPSWRGYEIYFNEIEKNLKANLDGLEVKTNNLYPYGKKLATAKNQGLIESPKIMTVGDFEYSDAFKLKQEAITGNMYLTEKSVKAVPIVDKYISTLKKATITAKFSGNALGVLFKMTEEGFNIEYKIDGGEAKTFKVEKGGNLSWQAYPHAQVFMLEHQLSEGEHTVEITFTSVNSSTRVNTNFGGLLVDSK